MKFIKDIGEFLKGLNFADFIFFFAVLVLMILIVTLIYFIVINKENKKEENLNETKEMKIAEEITRDLNNEAKPNIEFTDYEKDQESKAIISYEELLKKTKAYELNYEKEEYLDDLSVKKIDLDHIASSKISEKPKTEIRLISYAEEEAFLKLLKQLQSNLG